jgi:hypothetical protein
MIPKVSAVQANGSWTRSNTYNKNNMNTQNHRNTHHQSWRRQRSARQSGRWLAQSKTAELRLDPAFHPQGHLNHPQVHFLARRSPEAGTLACLRVAQAQTCSFEKRGNGVAAACAHRHSAIITINYADTSNHTVISTERAVVQGVRGVVHSHKVSRNVCTC